MSEQEEAEKLTRIATGHRLMSDWERERWQEIVHACTSRPGGVEFGPQAKAVILTVARELEWLTAVSEERDHLHAALTACRKALEPFARLFRWGKRGSAGDDTQVLWRKHFLTGERMKIVVDHLRLAAVAFYWDGETPVTRSDRDAEDKEFAALMADEIERAARCGDVLKEPEHTQ